MEILPNIHQIPVNYKNRPLHLYLLRAGGESMLMDTGDHSTPPKDILPYFDSIHFDAKSLTHILLTHPDLDHSGGIHAMLEAAPQAKVFCGTLDRKQIETPENLGNIRARAHYYFHGLGADDAKLAGFIQNAGGAGKRVTFAQTFNGGESMVLGGALEMRFVHLPGHSLGHLGVYLPKQNTAFIGDAVHGTANRFLPGYVPPASGGGDAAVPASCAALPGEGLAAFAPTYMWVDSYLGTIDRLQAMRLDRLYSCHWPNWESNEAVNTFLDHSRNYALEAEKAILQTLKAAGGGGMTLREICVHTKGQLGDWPSDRDTETRSMACGHLQRLFTQGLISISDDIPTRYIYNTQWLGLR